jgi:hypothetical protein
MNYSQRSTTTYFSYYPGSSKHDIDNIIIPFDTSCSGSRSTQLAAKLTQPTVATPRWRECPLEPMVDVTDEMRERLDDAHYEALHGQMERNRFDSGQRLKLAGAQLAASLPASLLASCLNETTRKKPLALSRLGEVQDERLSSELGSIYRFGCVHSS